MGIFLNIVSVIIEALSISFLINIFIRIMNKEDISNKYKKIFMSLPILLILFVVNNLITLYLPSLLWLKSILFILVSPIISIKIYKSTAFKGICAAIITLIISALINIIFALILKYLNIEPEYFISSSSEISISIYIISACEFTVYLILNYILRLLKNKSVFSFLNFKYIVPQLIAVAICLLPSMALLMVNDFKHSSFFIIINFLQLFAISITSMINSKNAIKYENTQLELSNTIQHNETLLKVNDGVRGFKHDMTNIVQSILGYVACKDMQGVKDYCDNLVVGFNDINILSILSPTVIDDPAIYGVVVNKILIARDRNMNLSLDINAKVSDINFPKFELSRMLGILLDNAIEAGEQTKDKKLIMNMGISNDETQNIITISNSIKDINIDVSKIFDKNYSTKEKPSGFGLYEISKFFNKYNQGNITTSIDTKNKIFTQTVIIKCKDNPKQLTIDDLILEA